MALVLVSDDAADAVRESITAAARTGEIGDGIVWEMPVEQGRNIGTGELIGLATLYYLF